VSECSLEECFCGVGRRRCRVDDDDDVARETIDDVMSLMIDGLVRRASHATNT
jgi:hypothetical protein